MNSLTASYDRPKEAPGHRDHLKLYRMSNNNKLQAVRLLDKQKAPYYKIKPEGLPPGGWISAIRKSLNMTLQQLGRKLGMTAQGARDLETREDAGSITISALRDAAAAMDMKLVYGFVPEAGSFEKMVETRARAVVEEVVARTEQNMVMGNRQPGGKEFRRKADAMASTLKQEMNRGLWD